MDQFNQLSQEFQALTGTTLDDHALQAAHRYADLLAEWNDRISLTSITAPEDVRIKHFLDSLSCHLVMAGTPVSQVIDVGSGGGFPGLPLKLLYPEMHLTLVDSVAKKTSFLSLVVQELGLEDVEVLTDRVEMLGRSSAHRQRYDWAVARGVARLPVLAEYLLPLVRVGGFMLAQKGETAEREMDEAQTAIDTLGGSARPPVEVRLPGIPELRYLLVIEKTAPTPARFPRRVGIPAKRPISDS